MTSSVYLTGTVSVSNGSPIVAGTDTAWDVALVTGGMFSFAGMSVPIASVESDTSLTLAYGWPGTTAGGTYAIARETSEAVRAAWINDRLAQILTKLSLAGIHPDGAGTLAERDALSPVPAAGYLWLRVEIGYGLDIYRRTASGWDGPFGLTGPEGPAGTLRWIEAGWSLGANFEYNDGLTRNGTSYRCFVAHTAGAATEPGVGANWQTVWKVTAAKGDSITFRGAYSGPTAYIRSDVVRDGGSSWVALQATTGNAPPTLPATANAFWELMAVKGQDGTGTGDVVGPAGAVSDRIAVFNSTTGKLIKDGGKTVAEVLARANHTGSQAISTVTSLQAALDRTVEEHIGTDIITSAVASIDRTGLSAYRTIIVRGWIAPFNNNVNVWLRTSSNNGTSYDSAAGTYPWQLVYSAGTAAGGLGDANASKVEIINGVGNGVAQKSVFSLTITDFNQTDYFNLVGASSVRQESSNLVAGQLFSQGGLLLPRNAIRLFCSVGNIAKAHIVWTGIRG